MEAQKCFLSSSSLHSLYWVVRKCFLPSFETLYGSFCTLKLASYVDENLHITSTWKDATHVLTKACTRTRTKKALFSETRIATIVFWLLDSYVVARAHTRVTLLHRLQKTFLHSALSSIQCIGYQFLHVAIFRTHITRIFFIKPPQKLWLYRLIAFTSALSLSTVM